MIAAFKRDKTCSGGQAGQLPALLEGNYPVQA
jgi:hypothetical protein